VKREGAWTPEEIEFLRRNAKHMTATEIARALGRSRWSVLEKAKKLGISLWNPLKKYHFDISKLTDFERGYLAGLVDGDGCITLNIARRRRAKKDSIQIRPTVFISSTSPEIIEYVMFLFRKAGFKWFYLDECNRGKQNRKNLIQIRIQDQLKVLAFLEAVTPFLRGKRRQAELVREFLRSRLSKRITGRGRAPYDKREVEIYMEVRKLNWRGKWRDEYMEVIKKQLKEVGLWKEEWGE